MFYILIHILKGMVIFIQEKLCYLRKTQWWRPINYVLLCVNLLSCDIDIELGFGVGEGAGFWEGLGGGGGAGWIGATVINIKSEADGLTLYIQSCQYRHVSNFLIPGFGKLLKVLVFLQNILAFICRRLNINISFSFRMVALSIKKKTFHFWKFWRRK